MKGTAICKMLGKVKGWVYARFYYDPYRKYCVQLNLYLRYLHGFHDVPECVVAGEAAAGHVVVATEEVSKVHGGGGGGDGEEAGVECGGGRRRGREGRPAAADGAHAGTAILVKVVAVGRAEKILWREGQNIQI